MNIAGSNQGVLTRSFYFLKEICFLCLSRMPCFRYNPYGEIMLPTVRELMNVGAHFGHQSRFKHPSMDQYIYGVRNQLSIINLDSTIKQLALAEEFLKQAGAMNQTVLFVCTKRSAKVTRENAEGIKVIENAWRREAMRCGMPYVENRWLGGTLTNFQTIKASIKRLEAMDSMPESVLGAMSKKERLIFDRKKNKLEAAVGGIKDMSDIPDVIVLCDVGFHKTAVKEANKLGVKLVAIVDTNHSPDGVDYVIPGNDDSAKANELYATWAADCILTGRAEKRDKKNLANMEAVATQLKNENT